MERPVHLSCGTQDAHNEVSRTINANYRMKKSSTRDGTCTHAPTCPYPHTPWCIPTRVHIPVHYYLSTLTHICVLQHVYTHTHTHTHKHTHTYTHIQHTHTHTHTHTFVCTLSHVVTRTLSHSHSPSHAPETPTQCTPLNT